MEERMNLLIVDDSKTNRAVLKGIFQDKYNIFEAEDGLVAIEVLKSQLMNVIILDLNMPHMDGFEVIAYMKKSPHFNSIPIIVNTQYGQEENELKALSMGAMDFISKPYNVEIVQHRVQNVLARDQYERQQIEIEMDKKLIQKMKTIIEKDALTGIYTREAFCNYTTKMLEDNPDKDYLLARFNISHFKVINDLFGSVIGDQILQVIAAKLEADLRGIGTYGRISGDTFVCCYPKGTYDVERILTKEGNGLNAIDIMYDVTFYAGVYEVVDRSVPVTLMCDRADMALQTVKGNYLTRIGYYTESLREKLLEEQELLNDLQRAMDEREICILLQPIYNIRNDEIASAEALVRWNHKTKGMISPGIFVLLCEKNGYITKLDCYVWELACQMLQKEVQAGHKIIPISVNISRNDLFVPDLAQTLVDLINKYGLETYMLKLEITETAYTADRAQLMKAVERLKEAGFTVVMDDFGNGYSSLNALKEMPVEIVKVDMSFTEDIERSEKSNIIMSNFIRMAKELGIIIVVEGVETQEQLDFLRKMDCDQIQGFFYSKPVSVEDFSKMTID